MEYHHQCPLGLTKNAVNKGRERERERESCHWPPRTVFSLVVVEDAVLVDNAFKPPVESTHPMEVGSIGLCSIKDDDVSKNWNPRAQLSASARTVVSIREVATAGYWPERETDGGIADRCYH